jgi:hypothetical protein
VTYEFGKYLSLTKLGQGLKKQAWLVGVGMDTASEEATVQHLPKLQKHVPTVLETGQRDILTFKRSNMTSS